MTIAACAEIVRKGDPDRFLATMATPVAARRVLFPIFAFNVEVAKAPWVTQEPMIAEMRLQWWRDALAEIAKGGIVRKHEVVTPLALVLDALGAEILDKLIQARRWDIYTDPFDGADHFSEYLDATAGGLMWAAARALGTPTGEDALRDIGWASGLAQWFLAIPELEARGKRPLADGRPAAVQDLARTGLDRYRRARPPKSAKPVLLTGWRTRALLRRAVQSPTRVAENTLAEPEFLRRLTLLRNSILGT